MRELCNGSLRPYSYLESTLNFRVLKLVLLLWFEVQQLLDLFQDLQTHPRASCAALCE